MKKAAKIGYIEGVNSYESDMLKRAIDYYTRNEFNAEPRIITASTNLFSKYRNIVLSVGWSDELAIILREQVKELVDAGAEYIVTPLSASMGFAYDAIFDGIETLYLNFYKRRLYLNLVPLLEKSRHGENLLFLGPDSELEMLSRSCVEEHTKNCDVPIAQFVPGDIDQELSKGLLTAIEDGLRDKVIQSINTAHINSGVGHLAVTDFWTERILLGKGREGFDGSIYTIAPFEIQDRYGCLPGEYKIFHPKIYNAALVFAGFVAWCSICRPSRLKRKLKTK